MGHAELELERSDLPTSARVNQVVRAPIPDMLLPHERATVWTSCQPRPLSASRSPQSACGPVPPPSSATSTSRQPFWQRHTATPTIPCTCDPDRLWITELVNSSDSNHCAVSSCGSSGPSSSRRNARAIPTDFARPGSSQRASSATDASQRSLSSLAGRGSQSVPVTLRVAGLIGLPVAVLVELRMAVLVGLPVAGLAVLAIPGMMASVLY